MPAPSKGDLGARRLPRRALLQSAIFSMCALIRLPARVRARINSKEFRVIGDPVEHEIAIEDFWPTRASYQPGDPAAVHLTIQSRVGGQFQIDLQVRFLDQRIGAHRVAVVITPGVTELEIPFELPQESFRGYGIDLTVLGPSGEVAALAGAAADVLDSWTQAPRYGFLSDFAPGDPCAAANVQALSRYHINVVQFYDWMWRHYILMPPTDDFIDGMGRALSLTTVRAKAAACQAAGMATMGYAAVYGAEPEYALDHPEEMLFDRAGKPYSIEELFYIMNIHQGNPWRPKILAEMARAVREAPFDGLHLDQYGFPKSDAYGPGPHPTLYDLAEDFPPFIDDAREAIRKARPDTKVIFNAVENWPIETVARSEQDATYIEVWPPYENYADLQMLILEARRLAPTKQVILAAYLAPLQGAMDDALPPAERATRLASAAIWANGGFHLLMGERNGALCHAYYPQYATLMPDFARVMRRYYDFVVRYENVLSDPRLVTADDAAPEAVAVAGRHASPLALPGSIWTIRRSMPGFRTLSLINLTSADTPLWNAPKPPVMALDNLSVEFPVGARVTSVFLADPDGSDTRPWPLTFTSRGEGAAARLQIELPRLEYWALIVARVDEEA